MNDAYGLAVGTNVTLRSGGPAMTVNARDIDRKTITCVWFKNDNTVAEFTFHIDALKLPECEEEHPRIPEPSPW